MTFDVTKFLALTAVLAGASMSAAACTTETTDDTVDGGGSGGAATGGESADGATGGAGGESAGGAGGVGGEGPACLSHDPSIEDGCHGATFTEGCDGADEVPYDPLSWTCSSHYNTNSAVLADLITCGLANASADVCDDAAVAADCAEAAVAKACETEEAVAFCTESFVELCEGFTTAECVKVLSVASTIDSDTIMGCFDPEGDYYDPTVEGSCSHYLGFCNSTLFP